MQVGDLSAAEFNAFFYNTGLKTFYNDINTNVLEPIYTTYKDTIC